MHNLASFGKYCMLICIWLTASVACLRRSSKGAYMSYLLLKTMFSACTLCHINFQWNCPIVQLNCPNFCCMSCMPAGLLAFRAHEQLSGCHVGSVDAVHWMHPATQPLLAMYCILCLHVSIAAIACISRSWRVLETRGICVHTIHWRTPKSWQHASDAGTQQTCSLSCMYPAEQRLQSPL